MNKEQVQDIIDQVSEHGTLLYLVESGSKSYGTILTEELAKKYVSIHGGNWEDFLSDLDLRGIFLSHRPDKFKEEKKKKKTLTLKGYEDASVYELAHFLHLALECNPNIVELLSVEEENILYMTEEGKELRSMIHLFLSKNAFSRYGSYVHSQMKKMIAKDTNDHQGTRKKLLDNHQMDTKAYMHAERLTDNGLEILNGLGSKTKRPNAEELIGYRFGFQPDGTKLTLSYARKRIDEKQKQMEEALKTSTIPDVPDFEKVNQWVMEVTDRMHGKSSSNGIFSANRLRILPPEYEMVDKATLLLVSNPLNRRKSKAHAQGCCVPHKDWFTGLRSFDEMKFGETTIEPLRKFMNSVKECNPRHLDVLFAGKQYILHQHPMWEEARGQLMKLLTAQNVFYKAKHYVEGNLKKMHHWEQLKEGHEAKKKKKKEAEQVSQSDWDQQFFSLDNQKEGMSREAFRIAKDQLTRQFLEWKHYREMPKLNALPDIPKKTSTEAASMMGKFGYDTQLAAQLLQVTKMYTELMKTGTIQDSRQYEAEMYSIKHGEYRTFTDFEVYIKTLLAELEKAHLTSVLPEKAKAEEAEKWYIDFTERYHEQLFE